MPMIGRLIPYTIGSTWSAGLRDAGTDIHGPLTGEETMTASETKLETVNVYLADGCATVELNRPEVLNAWNRQFGEDLLAALRSAAEDDSVRVVILTGAGRAFSSGADLKDVSGGDSTTDGRPDVYKKLT